jgi:hypothetical protein
MAAIKVANTAKDVGSESCTDLQKIIAKFKPPYSRENTKKKMNSDLMKTHNLLSQAHGIQIKKFKSVLSARKIANTSKDAGSESGADLQKIIAEFEPPDPSKKTS